MFSWVKIFDCRCSFLGGLFAGIGSIAGAGIQAKAQENINKQNIQMQKEFAQNSVQWKAQDAEKAGIHKLAGIGAQTYSASPSSIAPDVGSGVSGAMKHFGQAIDNYISDDEDKRQNEKEMQRLQIEEQKLKNSKLQKELSTMGQSSGGISDIYGSTPVLVDASHSLFQNTPKTWLSKALGKQQAIHLEQQANKGRATYLPNPDSFSGQTAQENIVSRALTHIGNYSDLAFTDLIHDMRKEAHKAGLSKDKSLIWYPGIDGPVIMEVDKSTADKFDKFTYWLKSFNPTKNYFTNGDFMEDLVSFFSKSKSKSKK